MKCCSSFCRTKKIQAAEETALKKMSVSTSDREKKRTSLAKKRLSELKSGKVKGRDGEEVFNNIWDRLS